MLKEFASCVNTRFYHLSLAEGEKNFKEKQEEEEQEWKKKKSRIRETLNLLTCKDNFKN